MKRPFFSSFFTSFTVRRTALSRARVLGALLLGGMSGHLPAQESRFYPAERADHWYIPTNWHNGIVPGLNNQYDAFIPWGTAYIHAGEYYTVNNLRAYDDVSALGNVVVRGTLEVNRLYIGTADATEGYFGLPPPSHPRGSVTVEDDGHLTLGENNPGAISDHYIGYNRIGGTLNLYGGTVEFRGSLPRLVLGTMVHPILDFPFQPPSVINIGNGGPASTITGLHEIFGEYSNIATAINFNSSDEYTLSADLRGSIALTVNGPGRLILTGEAHHSQPIFYDGTFSLMGFSTIVKPGRSLDIGNGGVTGDINSVHLESGRLNFNRSDTYDRPTYLTIGGINGNNITGQGTVAQIGSGTLILSGPNDFSGHFIPEFGTTVINHSHALQNAVLDLNWDGLVEISPTLDHVKLGGLAGTRDFYMNVLIPLELGRPAVFQPDTYAGDLTLPLITLKKTGTNHQRFTGEDNVVRELQVNGGQVSITDGGHFSINHGVRIGGEDGSTGLLTVSGNGSRLTIQEGGFLTVSDSPGSNGTLDIIEGGTLHLADGATLTIGGGDGAEGLAKLRSGGVLEIGGGNTFLTGPNSTGWFFEVSHGIIRVVRPDLDLSVPIRITLPQQGGYINETRLTFDTNGFDATFSGNIYGHSGGIAKTGAGTLYLGSPNIYEGGGRYVTIHQGTLSTLAENTLPLQTTLVLEGGTLQLNNFNLTANSLWGSTGTVDLGSAYLHLINGSEFGGSFAGSSTSRLVKGGAGTLTLSGSSTLASSVEITGGDILIADGGSFNTSGYFHVGYQGTGGFTIADGGSFNTSADFYIGYQGTGSLTVEGGGSVNAANAYLGRFAGDSGSAVVSGNFSANNLLIGYQGTGAFTLAEGGVLNVASNTIILGNSNGSSGTLHFGDGGVSGTTTATTIRGVHASGGGTVNFNHSNGLTLGAALIDNLAVTKNGTGTTTLTGANTYVRGTTVNSGILRAGSATALPQNTAYTINGGSLDLSGYALTASSLSGTGGNINLRLNANFTVNQSTDTTFGGSITGPGLSGIFYKQGTGGLTLSGSNAVNEIHANGGTLVISGQSTANGVGVGRQNDATGVLTVSGAGAHLHANNFFTVGDSTGSTGTLTVENGGLVSLNSGAKLTVGWENATGTLNLNEGGTIEVGGADGLQKHATGTTHFNLAGGTLRVAHADLTSTLDKTLAAGTNSTVDTNGFNATFSGNLTGSGDLTKAGPGILTLSGTNSYSGTTFVNAGTLKLGSAGSLSPHTTLQVAAGAAFDANGFQQTFGGLSGNGSLATGTGNIVVQPTAETATTFGGQISGDGGLTLDGPGTLTLTAASDYSGGTEILGGTLVIVDVGIYSVLGTGDVFVSEDGTLAGSGRVLGNATIAGKLSPGHSPGLLTFNDGLTIGESALVDLEIGGYERGVEHDAIDVDGALIYGGTLNITFIDGFLPIVSDEFALFGGSFNWLEESTFSSISFSQAGFDGLFDHASGVLTITAVPEPATCALIASMLGLAFVLLHRRKK